MANGRGMHAERLRMFGLAALRGAAVAGMAGAALFAFAFRTSEWVSCLLETVDTAPWDSAGTGSVVAVLGLGAVGGVLRMGVAPRSVGGAVWVWSTLVLSFLAVPAGVWPHCLNAIYANPWVTYGMAAALGALLGIVDLGLEAALPTARLAARGALLGASVGVGYALMDLAAALFVRPSGFTHITGNDFDGGVREGTRAIVTTLALAGGVLGFVTVAVHAFTESGRRWRESMRWAALVVCIWGLVPALLYGAWYLCGASSSPARSALDDVASVLLRGMTGPAPSGGTLEEMWALESMRRLLGVAALHGLGLGVVFVVLWIRWGARRCLAVPDSSPAPVRLRALLVLAAVATVSMAWQIRAARLPLERLQAGEACIRPVFALSGHGQTVKPALLFSPDSTTLWVRVDDADYLSGVCAGWRVRASSSDWRPDEAQVPAGTFVGLPLHEERESRWVDQRANRRMTLTPLPNSASSRLDVLDDGGRRLASQLLSGIVEPDFALRGALLVGRGPDSGSVFDWTTGKWWWRRPHDVRNMLSHAAVVSLDRRFLAVKQGDMLACYDIESRRKIVSVRVPSLVACGFDESTRRVIALNEALEQRAWHLPDGDEVTSSIWRHEALSPDGTLSATLTDDGAVVRDTRTGRVLATLYITSDRSWAAVAPDGRCNWEMTALKIVDGARSMNVPPDYPLRDPTLLPRVP